MSEPDERPTLPQPERVRASRAPALAVLAVGAVVLVVLVGVLPRLTAQPAPVNNPVVADASPTPNGPPTTPGPSPEPTISGCGSSLNPDVPRVLDETGLVEQCLSWHITSNDTATIAVSNPGGDENQLEVSWDGSRCEDFTSLTFRRSSTGNGFELNGERLEKLNDLCGSLPARTGVRVYLRERVVASSVSASLNAWYPGSGPLSETYAEPIAKVAWGSWKLDAEAHPTTQSTQLSVLVFDPDCSSGLRDPGQVMDPSITYSSTTVTVRFPVLQVRRPACITQSSVPMTIHLAHPLGNRQLLDGGGGHFSFQIQGGTAAISLEPGRIAVTARERARGQVEDQACPTTVNLDRRVPDAQNLESFLESRGINDGPVDHGRAWLGDWSDAATYFKAIESYTDGVNFHAIVSSSRDLGLKNAAAGSFALTRLAGLSIGGRWIWYPTFNFRALSDATVFTPAPCD